jgi:Ca2+-binding RTX toxin-like protein
MAVPGAFFSGIGGPPQPTDCRGAIDAGGSNLMQIPTGCTRQPGDSLTGVARLDAVLKDNGGPTPTLALMPGSIAIDAGANPASLAFDQRGPSFARTLVGATDIGAFEFRPECDQRPATIIGSRSADVLRGTRGPDVIQGLGGKDRILGLGGRDVICGAGGADRLSGGKGRDFLVGGAGSDVLRGGKSVDTLYGGSPHGSKSEQANVHDVCPAGRHDRRFGCPAA